MKQPEISKEFSQFTVSIDARGRLILPAPVRRHLSLKEGDKLILTLSKGATVQLSSRKSVANWFCGAYKHLVGKHSMADELITERRKEAANE